MHSDLIERSHTVVEDVVDMALYLRNCPTENIGKYQDAANRLAAFMDEVRAALAVQTQQGVEPALFALVRWLPIAHADKTITEVQDFSEVGITLQTSDRYWVRDADGRVYEAAWSEGNNGRNFWWDFEGESPVDPVEFAPHPLDPRFSAVTEEK